MSLQRLGVLSLVGLLALPGYTEPDRPARQSGFAFMSPQTQAMQNDDSLNPGLLWVKQGDGLWRRPEGPGQKSCETCHAQAAMSMRGVATRYPAWDQLERRPIDLAQRINLCRTRHQLTTPLAAEGQYLLALTSLVARQSRGLPIAPPGDADLAPHLARGRAQYFQRMGQLDLSCAACHDDLVGKRLGSSQIPPADAAPYPVYRLQWQTLGSLQRRIRNCMTGVHAEPFEFGVPQMVELELYLAARAKGLVMEAPGVRP